MSDRVVTVTSQPSRQKRGNVVNKKISYRDWKRGAHKDVDPAITYCEGSYKTMDEIPDYIGSKRKCGFCWEDMRPNYMGVAPKHPPGQMRFTFKIKYPDTCQIGWHPIPAGTRCRYFGVKLVCADHV